MGKLDRQILAHSYEKLDMEQVYQAASEGPSDLRDFLAAVQKVV